MRLHQVPVCAEGSVGGLGRTPPTTPSCIKLPRRQPALGLAPASRASSHSRPQQLSSSVLVAAAATGREASTSAGESHASSLSPEAAKEGMQWLAKWVSSQYMGMGKSAEDAMPELRRRGVVCSDASNGQVLFRVPGHGEPLDGPSVIRLLNLKARPGIKQTEPQPPPGLVRSSPSSRASSEAPSPSGGNSPRSTSPSREYQVGRLPDSPDAAAMRWLSEWIASHYSGLGKQAEDVLPELRRRGVVYSSIKDGRVMFRVPGVTSRVEARQIIQMLRLQPRPGMKPSEPKPPQSLIGMLTSDNRQDASPMSSRAASPSSSRSSSPNRYGSPSKTRASSSLSPEAATLGMRWLAIFVSSQYQGMGRSAEDALPELRAMGVVCSSVQDGRPMFIVPGHPEEVDAQEVVKLLRLELRPGVRPRAPTPPPALKGNGASSTQTLDKPAPSSDAPAAPSGKPAASVEDGIRYLAAWVSQNYIGMGKTLEDVLPELRRQGVVCSSVVGTTPLYRMRGKQQEMDAGSVIKALRLQARPGVDASKPAPPPGLKLGAPPPPRVPTPQASPKRPTTAAKAAAPAPTSARPPAAKAQPQQGAAAAPSAGKKEAGQEAPPSTSGASKGIAKDISESATGQLVLPATVTLLVAAALGGGSLAIKEVSKSGFFNPDRLEQERGLPGNVPQSGSNNVTGGPPYSPVKPRESMMLQAPPVGQQPSGVQPLDSDGAAFLRAQEQEQRRVEREEMERVQREREAREQMRMQLEQQDRELRAQNMRIQEEQARLDREARANEQRQQEERARMERQEREQREQQQREQERREREQREREQKERAQKEKEDRERAQKEEREQAQREKEQREREQREREQQRRMESEMSPPEQPKGLLGQKPSGVQPLPGRQTQPLSPPNQARGVAPENRGGVQPKPGSDGSSGAEPRGGVVPLSEAGKQESKAPEGSYEPPNQPKGVLPSETPTSGGKGGEDKTDGKPSMATMMPEDPTQGAMKESRDKWGSRTNVEKVTGDEGDREEDLAKQAPTLTNPSTRAGGLTQDQVEGYEACLFRSIGC